MVALSQVRLDFQRSGCISTAIFLLIINKYTQEKIHTTIVKGLKAVMETVTSNENLKLLTEAFHTLGSLGMGT